MTKDERDLLLSVAAYTALFIKSHVSPIDLKEEDTRFLLLLARLNETEYSYGLGGLSYRRCYEGLMELIRKVASKEASAPYGWVA